MNDRYQHFEQHLTPSIAQDLILELFAGSTAQRQEIVRRVDEVHRERGGQPPTAKVHHPAAHALSKMKRIGLANNPKRGHWSISSKESPESEAPSRSEKQDSIKSLNEFIKWVQGLPQGEYVYRGVSNKDYEIEASTYRRLKDEKGNFRNEEDKGAERLRQINWEMIEDAKRHRHGWENEQPPPDLVLLAKLQHSGAATCLIDFTRNPLVALWMACRKSGSGSVPGKVYAIEISSGSPFKPVSSDEARQMEINDFFQGDKKTGYQLYQWQPDYQDNRMLAQQSVFLFGGSWDAIKLSKSCVISEKHKQEIWDSLKKSAGISEDILFPDFEGFASQRAQNKSYYQPDVPIKTGSEPDSQEDVTDEAIDEQNQKESAAISYLRLSLDALQEGNTEAATQYYNRGMEFEPTDQLLNHFYRERAIIHYNKGNKEYFELAISDYDEAIRLNANDENSYRGRGKVNYELGEYTESIGDFDTAINLNSNNADTYYWRGLAKYHLQQYREAIIDFDRAINLDPTEAYFYYWRGLASLELNHYQDAIDYFDQSIRLNPSYAYPYYWRGLAKYHLQQYREAIIDFDRAINLNPTEASFNGYVYYWQGKAKKQMGLFSKANVDFHTALMCAEEAGNDSFISLIKQELLPNIL